MSNLHKTAFMAFKNLMEDYFSDNSPDDELRKKFYEDKGYYNVDLSYYDGDLINFERNFNNFHFSLNITACEGFYSVKCKELLAAIHVYVKHVNKEGIDSYTADPYEGRKGVYAYMTENNESVLFKENEHFNHQEIVLLKTIYHYFNHYLPKKGLVKKEFHFYPRLYINKAFLAQKEKECITQKTDASSSLKTTGKRI